jgi:hypothetical protein
MAAFLSDITGLAPSPASEQMLLKFADVARDILPAKATGAVIIRS